MRCHLVLEAFRGGFNGKYPEAERLPGVAGVMGAATAAGGGGSKLDVTMRGKITLEIKVVMEKIKRANVPIRVACSQVSLISSSVMLGLASKNGSTYISPT